MILPLLVPIALLLVQTAQASLHSQNATNEELHLRRSKRDLIGFMCPRSAAVGPDVGQNSYIIFYSPTRGEDIILPYGPQGWDNETMEILVANGFNSSRPTLLYSHAFHQSANQNWLRTARSIYDQITSASSEPLYNMLIFDWSSYSNFQYFTSVSYVPHLARVLGEFMDKLGKFTSYDMDKLHVIGYSLSTHITGQASRLVAKSYAPVGQLTALDPTGVCMHHVSKFASDNAIRPSDAKFLVARHYNMDEFGAKRPIGGLDIFINGGRLQPMAPVERSRSFRFVRSVEPDSEFEDDEELDDEDMVVSARADHHRATEHEVQALDDQCHDIAYECASYEAYLRGECADCGPDGSKCYFVSNYKNILAESRGEQLRATYRPGTQMFLKTHFADPFCLHHYQVVAELTAGAPTSTRGLLSAGQIEIVLQDGQIASFSGSEKGNRFTTLVSSTTKLQGLSSMTLRVNAVESAMGDFLSSLDHVEMNYMSHYSPEERAKASLRLCLNGDKNSLIRCESA